MLLKHKSVCAFPEKKSPRTLPDSAGSHKSGSDLRSRTWRSAENPIPAYPPAHTAFSLLQIFPFPYAPAPASLPFQKQDPVCFQIILGVVLIQYDLTGTFDLLCQQLLKLHDLRCQLPAMEHDFFFRCFRIYFHSYLHLTTSCCCHYTVSKINVNAFSVSGRNTPVSGRK